jgi:hypothetical protein
MLLFHLAWDNGLLCYVVRYAVCGSLGSTVVISVLCVPGSRLLAFWYKSFIVVSSHLVWCNDYLHVTYRWRHAPPSLWCEWRWWNYSVITVNIAVYLWHIAWWWPRRAETCSNIHTNVVLKHVFFLYLIWKCCVDRCLARQCDFIRPPSFFKTGKLG